jgi:hypothetical protein
MRVAGDSCNVPYRRLTWILIEFVSCVVLLCAFVRYACGENSREKNEELRVRALAAATDQWLRDVRFACSFEILDAASDALLDQILNDIENDRFPWASAKRTSRGEFVKGEHVIRRWDIPEEPSRKIDDIWSTPGETNFARNMRTGVVLMYYPDGPHNGVAQFGRENGAFGPFPQETPAPAGLAGYSPLVPFGETRRPNYLRFLLEEQRRGNATFRPIVRVGDTTQIGAKWTLDGATIDFTLEYWMTPKVPILKKITLVGSNNRTRVSLYRDFQQVEGGLVASKVFIIYDSGKPSPKYYINVWKSDDLGRRQLVPEDYAVRIPQKVEIHGLKWSSWPPSSGGYRNVDVSKLSAKDLSEDDFGNLEFGAKTRRRFGWFWLLAIFGVGLFVIGWQVYRRRR